MKDLGEWLYSEAVRVVVPDLAASKHQRTLWATVQGHGHGLLVLQGHGHAYWFTREELDHPPVPGWSRKEYAVWLADAMATAALPEDGKKEATPR